MALQWALVAEVLNLLLNIAPITGVYHTLWVGGVGNWGVLCAFLLVFFSLKHHGCLGSRLGFGGLWTKCRGQTVIICFIWRPRLQKPRWKKRGGSDRSCGKLKTS